MSNYTRESLENMTCAELREMCADRNITGVSKTRKDALVNYILDFDKKLKGDSDPVYADPGYNEPETLQPKLIDPFRISLTSVVVDEDAKEGKRMSTLVRVSSGSSSEFINAAGMKVQDIIETCKEIFNIDITASILVNGRKVDIDYVLKAGESLEFLKPSGEKSNN